MRVNCCNKGIFNLEEVNTVQRYVTRFCDAALSFVNPFFVEISSSYHYCQKHIT